MTAKRWIGTWPDLTVFKRWNGSAWVDLTLAKRWDGGSWVDISLPGGGSVPLSLTISPGYAYGETVLSNPPFPTAQTVYSNAVTAAAAGGGAGTPTYAWHRISGSASITATNPSSATTAFQATLTRNREASAVFRCITQKGIDLAQADIEVSLAYFSGDIA